MAWRGKRSRWALVALTAALLVAAALGAFARLTIPSGSMRPSIRCGDRIAVLRRAVDPRSVRRGDVVVFHAISAVDERGRPDPGSMFDPGATDREAYRDLSRAERSRRRTRALYVKRVVAVGGDRVAMQGQRLMVNGRRERGTSPDLERAPANELSAITPYTVPEGTVFLLGDNRANSADSRIFGPVPLDFVVGRAVAVYWPLRHLGPIGRHIGSLTDAPKSCSEPA
jgi:signal peptidase I